MHVLTEQEKEFLEHPDKFRLHPNRRKIKHKIFRKIQIMVSDFEFFCKYFDEDDNSYSKNRIIWGIGDHREFLNREDMIKKFPLINRKLKKPRAKEVKLKIKK